MGRVKQFSTVELAVRRMAAWDHTRSALSIYREVSSNGAITPPNQRTVQRWVQEERSDFKEWWDISSAPAEDIRTLRPVIMGFMYRLPTKQEAAALLRVFSIDPDKTPECAWESARELIRLTEAGKSTTDFYLGLIGATEADLEVIHS